MIPRLLRFLSPLGRWWQDAGADEASFWMGAQAEKSEAYWTGRLAFVTMLHGSRRPDLAISYPKSD